MKPFLACVTGTQAASVPECSDASLLDQVTASPEWRCRSHLRGWVCLPGSREYLEVTSVLQKKNKRRPKKGVVVFATFFISTKGNIFYAADYGHKCWPIGRRKK